MNWEEIFEIHVSLKKDIPRIQNIFLKTPKKY